MIIFGKKNKQLRNANTRRVLALLFRNFFTLEEFKSLPRRQALRVLKLISKAENLRLSRAARNSLYYELISYGDKRSVPPVISHVLNLTFYYEVSPLFYRALSRALSNVPTFLNRLISLRL